MPGDTVTDYVVVENDGTAELRYAMTSASTNGDGLGLRTVLTLTIKTIDATTPLTPCNDFDGTTTLYGGVLGASTAAFGDPTGRPGQRSDARRRRERDAVLPGLAPEWDRQRLPGCRDDDDLHVRRREDVLQRLARARTATG